MGVVGWDRRNRGVVNGLRRQRAYCRAAAAFGGLERPSAVLLQPGEEGAVSEGAANGFGAAQPHRQVLVLAPGQKVFEARVAREDGRLGGQAVVVDQAQQCVNARPGPIDRPPHQARPDGIERHIAQGGGEVGLIHGDTAEATLPEMPGALQPGVDMAGIAAVDRRQNPPQSVRLGRDQDQVDMVGHENPGPHLHARRRRVLGQEVAIELIVIVAEEGLRPSIASLGHMVRKTGENRASETSHAGELRRRGLGVN